MPVLKNSQNFLFFLKFPNLKNLITLHLSLCSDRNSHQSEFHLKILSCRKLIFAENEILASPVNDGLGNVIAIIQKEKQKSQEFLEKLRILGLKIVGVEDTNLSSLKECLQYTSSVKMSPMWNIIKNVLVEGPDFLTSNGPLKAVKMDIFVSFGEITLSLQPMCVRLPSMKLEHFVHPEQLMNNNIIPIEEFCHVLPSLKRGKVTSASRFPGVTGTFQSYEDLKNHWKDMYGYLLPNISEENIWYYNVSFRIPFSRSYTYPEFCVRPYGMMNVPRVDPRPILTAFVKDFCKKVGNICGEKCKVVEGRASFPTLELYLATNVNENMKPRAGTTYVMKPSVPYRKDITLNAAASSSTEKQSQCSFKENGTNFTSKKVSSTSHAPKETVSPPKLGINQDRTEKRPVHPQYDSSKIPLVTSKEESKVSENPPPKIVPRFFPVVKKVVGMTSNIEATKSKPYAPVFLPKKKIPTSQKRAVNTASTSKEDWGSVIAKQPESCDEEKQTNQKINSIIGNSNKKKKCDADKDGKENGNPKKKSKIATKEKGSNKRVKKEANIKP